MSSSVLTLFLLLFSSYRSVFFYQEVGTCVLSTVDLLLSLIEEPDILCWLQRVKMSSSQCHLNVWARWAVAPGAPRAYGSHSNLVDNMHFSSASGCLGKVPIALLCPGVYSAVKTALFLLIYYQVNYLILSVIIHVKNYFSQTCILRVYHC